MNGNTILFTLWNQMADDFEEDRYAALSAPPVILAVSSCFVKTNSAGRLQLSATPVTSYYFNPRVPETAHMLSVYEQFLGPEEPIQVDTHKRKTLEEEMKRNRIPLNMLIGVDPTGRMGERFTTNALIRIIDEQTAWYFN